MRALLLWFSVVTASAQMVTNPDRVPERLRNFEAAPGRLPCRVEPIKPSLNLGFHFQTGFFARISMNQNSDRAHWWTSVLRVTPEEQEREPVWLVSRYRVPAGPLKGTAEVVGAYLVGEGRYRVDMVLADGQRQLCHASWNVRAKLSRKARAVRPGLPPGTVDDISLRRRRIMGPEDAGARYEVAILMHAAAMSPNRVHLRNQDRMVLMSALSSMLERLPVRKVRLTIFNMDKQQELYHADELTGRTFREAVDALNGLETGIVNYSTLMNRGGHLDLLSELVQRELASERPPDAIIFLGPVARWDDKMSEELLPDRARPVFYVQLRSWNPHWQGDAITRMVRKLGGQTKAVYSPDDFAVAIQELERLLTTRRE